MESKGKIPEPNHTDAKFSSSNGNHELIKNKNKKESSIRSQSITLTIPRWLYCYTSIIIVIVAIVFSLCIRYKEQAYMNEKIQTLGIEVLDIFANFDQDGDFFLSLEEAEPLLLQFVDQSKDKDNTLNIDVKPGENSIKIFANFIPVNISTMTKDFEHDLSGNKSFTGLFNWQSVSMPIKEFPVSRFQSFLPDSKVDSTPGTVYNIVASPKGLFGSSNLPSDRFYPPRVLGVEIFLHRLLSMFHPRPFVVMRFPPQGVRGCVRAVSQDFIEVVFRMHIEFQLNEPPDLPFWFTPSQLTGSMIMAKDGSVIKHFYLHVPNKRHLNVDMEWLVNDKNQESMEVDIGYMPLMELTGQSLLDRVDEEDQGVAADSIIHWDSEISRDEADELLEKSFFPFTKIKYYNITEAFHIAEKESKLVHSILLWGALDDQSC